MRTKVEEAWKIRVERQFQTRLSKSKKTQDMAAKSEYWLRCSNFECKRWNHLAKIWKHTILWFSKKQSLLSVCGCSHICHGIRGGKKCWRGMCGRNLVGYDGEKLFVEHEASQERQDAFLLTVRKTKYRFFYVKVRSCGLNLKAKLWGVN